MTIVQKLFVVSSAILFLGACPKPRVDAPAGRAGEGAIDSQDAADAEWSADELDEKKKDPQPIITDEGVGDVLIGRPFPARLLSDVSNPIGRYVYGFHSDAQTYEGFALPGMPVRALFATGPFSRWFNEQRQPDEEVMPSKNLVNRFAIEAVAAARDGAPVSWIVVDGPGVLTSNSIGVGSTYAEVMNAHPDVKMEPIPPTFGDDECYASLDPSERLLIFFHNCEKARAGGAVTRIFIGTGPDR